MNAYDEHVIISEKFENQNDATRDVMYQLKMLKRVNEKWHRKLDYIHWCPRCRRRTKISSHYPYCTHCNWDSVTDPSLTPRRWRT